MKWKLFLICLLLFSLNLLEHQKFLFLSLGKLSTMSFRLNSNSSSSPRPTRDSKLDWKRRSTGIKIGFIHFIIIINICMHKISVDKHKTKRTRSLKRWNGFKLTNNGTQESDKLSRRPEWVKKDGILWEWVAKFHNFVFTSGGRCLRVSQSMSMWNFDNSFDNVAHTLLSFQTPLSPVVGCRNSLTSHQKKLWI